MTTRARKRRSGGAAGAPRAAVGGEVPRSLAGGVAITAVLTRRSIEDLEPAVGRPAIALTKASFIVLATGGPLRTSARNQIPGAVAWREDGAVNTEVGLDIGGGKTLVATVTLESAQALDLKPGDAVTALVKAPHVILAVE